MIYTIGDSHAMNGWDSIPTIVRNNIGARLCFSIGRDGITLPEMKEGDTVIFCFGEIDCRCHIYKHITEDRGYKDIIDSIVEKYFLRIQEAVSSKRLRTMVYNVVPPVRVASIDQNPAYPHLGTDEERRMYTLYFNETLKKFCTKYGYIFFDIYDKYIDEDGFLLRELADDSVHIRNGMYLKRFLDAGPECL